MLDAELAASCSQMAGRSTSSLAEQVIGGPEDPGSHPA
jgi:hypothetical protein